MLSLAAAQPGGQGEYLRARAGGVRFESPRRQLAVYVNEPTAIIVRRDSSRGDVVQVYLAIATDSLAVGQTTAKTFTLEATGEIDRNPIALTLDPTRPGRVFDGLGGNFRPQNPDADPQVIRYALDNLRVAWGRVEMPWRFWHPEEGGSPLGSARAGRLHVRVQVAMEMAQRLDQRGIPVIVSAWSAPEWALVGPVSFGPRPDGVWGNPLDSLKTDQIYASITAYLSHLKERYGVEAAMFSFNESDLGIYIRQTADYSPLAGGGIFGNEEPLRPTQRFWNLKQLASTPEGLRALPIACSSPDVTCAALGDGDEGIYAVHLVNNGTTRQATLSGLPREVEALRLYVTNHARGMEEGALVPVSNGQARFTLDATSYTTLISDR